MDCSRCESCRVTRRIVVRGLYSSIDESVDRVEALLPLALRSDLVRAGIVEALGNSILHGTLRVDSRLREAGELDAWLDHVDARERLYRDLFVRVDVSLCGEGACVSFIDNGPGFDWRRAPARPGRGLSILRAAFADMRWNGAGNVLSVFILPARSS